MGGLWAAGRLGLLHGGIAGCGGLRDKCGLHGGSHALAQWMLPGGGSKILFFEIFLQKMRKSYPYSFLVGKKNFPDATKAKKDKFYMDIDYKRHSGSNGIIRLGPKCSKKLLFVPIEEKNTNKLGFVSLNRGFKNLRTRSSREALIPCRSCEN